MLFEISYENKTWMEASRKHIIHVIDDGRATANNIGTKPAEMQKPWEFEDDVVREHPVYISANGNVTSCCDMSFRRIDKECKGNVLHTPLPEIIKSSCINSEVTGHETKAI